MTTASPIGSWSDLQHTPFTRRSTSEDDSPQYAAGNEPLTSWAAVLERPTLASTGDPLIDDRTAIASTTT